MTPCTCVAIVLLIVIALCTMLYSWGEFLDRNEHDPGCVRRAMLMLLAIAIAIELGLSLAGFTPVWVALVALVADTWGGLDACMRFPAPHRSKSLFSMKQAMLIFLKIGCYVTCMVTGVMGVRRDFVLFSSLLLLDLWGLPLLYMMAMPVDPAEQVARDETHDIDLAVRLWQLAVSASKRRHFLATTRGWWYRRLNAVSEQSPLARLAVCAASPVHRRVWRQRSRCV